MNDVDSKNRAYLEIKVPSRSTRDILKIQEILTNLLDTYLLEAYICGGPKSDEGNYIIETRAAPPRWEVWSKIQTDLRRKQLLNGAEVFVYHTGLTDKIQIWPE